MRKFNPLLDTKDIFSYKVSLSFEYYQSLYIKSSKVPYVVHYHLLPCVHRSVIISLEFLWYTDINNIFREKDLTTEATNSDGDSPTSIFHKL